MYEVCQGPWKLKEADGLLPLQSDIHFLNSCDINDTGVGWEEWEDAHRTPPDEQMGWVKRLDTPPNNWPHHPFCTSKIQIRFVM